jgi:aminocarboxymuconate-semialdehyde decarboxylase
VHAHLVPFDPARAGRLPGVRVLEGVRLEIDGHAVALEDLYRPEALLRWMDAQRVDVALISAPPPLFRPQLDASSAAAWVDYVNDGLEAIAARFPGRLRTLAYLPIEHPDLAAKVARARGGIYGFSAASGGTTAVTYSAPALRPLWQALDRGGAFLFLHPGSCADGRLRAFYAENLLGNPYETAVAVAHLVFGGIIEDHPRIRFCLAHCGGVVPAVAGRWQRGHDTARPGVVTTRLPPREILGRVWVDSIAHDPNLIALAISVFGPDKILFGSDWPFPMGLADPAAQLGALPAETLARILHNGASLIAA